MIEKSKREEIIEVVNKLFVFTDQQLWAKLQKDVFAPNVLFDMSSAGGGPASQLSSKQICDLWEKGFAGIDSIHHQAGNYLVTISEDVKADVFCYAIATHYKRAATKGNVREFVGSYDVSLVLTDLGWRISAFRYNLKYINGNTSLE
jgi:hypothetical protein